MATKRPGCVSSPLLCSYTTDSAIKPIVLCGAVASHVFESKANGSTFYVCPAHLASERQRIPTVIVNVTAITHLLPETSPVSG